MQLNIIAHWCQQWRHMAVAVVGVAKTKSSSCGYFTYPEYYINQVPAARRGGGSDF